MVPTLSSSVWRRALGPRGELERLRDDSNPLDSLFPPPPDKRTVCFRLYFFAASPLLHPHAISSAHGPSLSNPSAKKIPSATSRVDATRPRLDPATRSPKASADGNIDARPCAPIVNVGSRVSVADGADEPGEKSLALDCETPGTSSVVHPRGSAKRNPSPS